MNIEDIKFYALLSVPFLLLAILLLSLIFAKRIPSPVFIYKFFSAITSPIRKLWSSFSYTLSKKVFGQIFIENSEIPQEVLNRIGPSNRDRILSAIKVLPTIRLMKNGKKYLRTLMIISNEYIYFLLYIKGRPILQMERLLLKNVSIVEAKTQEVLGLIKKPFISIKTMNDENFELIFPSNKIGLELIMKLLDTFKKAENELKIISNLPSDLRGHVIREYDDATTEIRQEMNKDLKDIFK
jgi:hypothetical protein